MEAVVMEAAAVVCIVLVLLHSLWSQMCSTIPLLPPPARLSAFASMLSLLQVLERRYYTPASSAAVYRILAAFYRSQADPHSNGRWESFNPRPFMQLPPHVLKAEGLDGLTALLLDVRFLAKKACVTRGVAELQSDLRLCPLSAPAATLRKAVEESAASIQGDPLTLPFQLAGRLSWATDPALVKLCVEARSLCFAFAPINSCGLSPTAPAIGTDIATKGGIAQPAVGLISTVGFKPDTGRGTPSLVTVSKDGRYALVVCFEQMLVLSLPLLTKVLEVSLVQEMTVYLNFCSAGAFSRDGTYFCVAGGPLSRKAPRITVWETGSGHRQSVLTGHTKGIHAVTFHPDGKRVLSASIDGTCRVWDYGGGMELACFEGHTGHEVTNCFVLDPTTVVTAGKDNKLIIWSLEDLSKRLHRLMSWLTLTPLLTDNFPVLACLRSFAPLVLARTRSHRPVCLWGILR